MSTAAGRAAPSAQAGADGVSRRDIAALVYNYLRSNGFAKVRPRAAALVVRPSPPRVPTMSFQKKQRSARSRPARPHARPHAPTLPSPDPSPAPVPRIAQAAKQFRTDADPLLAPFRNRVPTGVVGLEHIVGEYVAARARDAARRAAMEANPLARRMYEQLDDYAMTAAGIAAPAHARTDPGHLGITRRHHPSDDAYPRTIRPDAAAARRRGGPRPILPAPTREERERMAAAAAAAASARAHAQSAGAGPREASTVHAATVRAHSPRRRKPGFPVPRAAREPALGSLMDDVHGEDAGGGGWRPYELPRELGDARVQERLAEYIVGVVRAGGGGGGPDEGSPGGWGGSGGSGGSGGAGGAGGSGGGVGVVDVGSSSPGAARAGAAERGVHLTDRDVEELTSQLWDDAELGRLLAPLLGPAGGGERRAGGGGTGLGGTASAGPSPLGARGTGGARGGVEGDAFADPPAVEAHHRRLPSSTPIDAAAVDTRRAAADAAVRVGSKRRKGSAPAKSRAGARDATGGANLPPELRGVDLDNLLDGIEY